MTSRQRPAEQSIELEPQVRFRSDSVRSSLFLSGLAAKLIGAFERGLMNPCDDIAVLRSEVERVARLTTRHGLLDPGLAQNELPLRDRVDALESEVEFLRSVLSKLVPDLVWPDSPVDP